MKKNNNRSNAEIADSTGHSGAALYAAAAVPYLLCAVIPMLLFLIMTETGWINQTSYIEPLMQLAILAAFGIFLAHVCRKGFRLRDLMTLIVIIGIIMRIGYMLYTNYGTRAHDIGFLDETSYGHAKYIWILFTEHHLPDSNTWQFYHPPFFYLAAQIPLAITSFFFPNASSDVLIDSAKVVSCFASCSGLLLVKRICEEFMPRRSYTAVQTFDTCHLQPDSVSADMKNTDKIYSLSDSVCVLILAIVSLHPNFFLMGGRVNNDALMIFFEILILLYTIRWYKTQSVKNTVILALAYGFGMMTKTSCGTLALFTAPVMLYIWFKSRKTPDFQKIFAKGILFLAICIPLALWYPVRNLILFDQPLNYVLKLSETSSLYCGDNSVTARFFSLSLTELKEIYAYPYDDCNIAAYLLKNSIFGEFTFDISEAIPALLLYINILIVAVSLAATFYVVIRGKQLSGILRFGLPWFWVTQLISYYTFQISYPFGCTMDFRYIPVTAVTGAVMIGATLQLLKANNPRSYKYIFPAVATLTGLFCILSTAMYCSIG